MPTASGKKPQDHQKSTARAEIDAKIEADAFLADMPPLVEPHRLRFRDKASFRALMLDVAASGVFDEGGEVEVDGNSIDPADVAKIKQLDTLCADIDEWAESIALDKPAYAEWAGGKGYNEFFAILNRYDTALGESTGS